MSIIRSINWSIVVSILLAAVGWYVVNKQNAERDRRNKLRDITTQYLIDAYRNLSDASMRPPQRDSIYFRKIESAISDIQLFGSQDQINLAYAMMEEYSKTRVINLDPILNNLRS